MPGFALAKCIKLSGNLPSGSGVRGTQRRPERRLMQLRAWRAGEHSGLWGAAPGGLYQVLSHRVAGRMWRETHAGFQAHLLRHRLEIHRLDQWPPGGGDVGWGRRAQINPQGSGVGAQSLPPASCGAASQAFHGICRASVSLSAKWGLSDTPQSRFAHRRRDELCQGLVRAGNKGPKAW